MQDYVPIDEFPQYGVNEYGEVIRFEDGRQLTPFRVSDDYFYVAFYDNGKQFNRSIAQLVAKAFLPKPEPWFNAVIHLDNNRHNNSVDNLAWRPRWFAVAYRQQMNSRLPIISPVRIRQTGERFPSIRILAATYGLLESEILQKLDTDMYVFPFDYCIETA